MRAGAELEVLTQAIEDRRAQVPLRIREAAEGGSRLLEALGPRLPLVDREGGAEVQLRVEDAQQIAERRVGGLGTTKVGQTSCGFARFRPADHVDQLGLRSPLLKGEIRSAAGGFASLRGGDPRVMGRGEDWTNVRGEKRARQRGGRDSPRPIG